MMNKYIQILKLSNMLLLSIEYIYVINIECLHKCRPEKKASDSKKYAGKDEFYRSDFWFHYPWYRLWWNSEIDNSENQKQRYDEKNIV